MGAALAVVPDWILDIFFADWILAEYAAPVHVAQFCGNIAVWAGDYSGFQKKLGHDGIQFNGDFSRYERITHP